MANSTTLSIISGRVLVTLGNTRVGEEYILGALVPKNKPNWHGPWDCAEFTSWLVYQTTGRLYGCQNNMANPAVADAYTGYYNRDARAIGKIITINEAASTPGAFLLRIGANSLPGHVVVCDGDGGTVEAHGHADGVINGSVDNRRWDYGILVPWINYDLSATVIVSDPVTTVYRVTNPRMVAPEVGEIQAALLHAGFDPKGVDNVYGMETAKAVLAFQEANGLLADGEVGAQTAAALGIEL